MRGRNIKLLLLLLLLLSGVVVAVRGGWQGVPLPVACLQTKGRNVKSMSLDDNKQDALCVTVNYLLCQITTFWLPLLKQVAIDQDEEPRPVIIVGNKVEEACLLFTTIH